MPLNTACPWDSISSPLGEHPLEGARLSVLVHMGVEGAGLRCLQNPADVVTLLGWGSWRTRLLPLYLSLHVTHLACYLPLRIETGETEPALKALW